MRRALALILLLPHAAFAAASFFDTTDLTALIAFLLACCFLMAMTGLLMSLSVSVEKALEELPLLLWGYGPQTRDPPQDTRPLLPPYSYRLQVRDMLFSSFLLIPIAAASTALLEHLVTAKENNAFVFSITLAFAGLFAARIVTRVENSNTQKGGLP